MNPKLIHKNGRKLINETLKFAAKYYPRLRVVVREDGEELRVAVGAVFPVSSYTEFLHLIKFSGAALYNAEKDARAVARGDYNKIKVKGKKRPAKKKKSVPKRVE